MFLKARLIVRHGILKTVQSESLRRLRLRFSTFRNFREFLGMLTWKSQHWLATHFSTLCYYVDLKLTKPRRPRLSMFWQLSRLSRQTKVRPWPRSWSRVLLAYSWLIKKNSTLSWNQGTYLVGHRTKKGLVDSAGPEEGGIDQVWQKLKKIV